MNFGIICELLAAFFGSLIEGCYPAAFKSTINNAGYKIQMKVKRSLRVSELLKREISDIIANKVRNQLVKKIIVTYVKVSDDLKYTKVYYRLIGATKNNEKIEKALERVTKFVRHEIANRTDLRYVPEIHFFYDSGIDEAERIDYLLEKLKKSRIE